MGIPWIVNRKTGNNYRTPYLLPFLYYLHFLPGTHSQHQVDFLKNLLYFFLNYFHFTFPNSPHSYLIHGPLPPKCGYLGDLDIETTPSALELNQSNNISRPLDGEPKNITKI